MAVKIVAVEFVFWRPVNLCVAKNFIVASTSWQNLLRSPIESLGFYEFGNFHNSRLFMTNLLVQAMIPGLALTKQENTFTTIDKVSLRTDDGRVASQCVLRNKAVSHNDMQNFCVSKQQNQIIFPGIKVYYLSIEQWDFFRKFFGFFFFFLGFWVCLCFVLFAKKRHHFENVNVPWSFQKGL